VAQFSEQNAMLLKFLHHFNTCTQVFSINLHTLLQLENLKSTLYLTGQ